MGPLELAEQMGHVMTTALPYGADQRWVCERCWLAVVQHGPNIYGAAIERKCSWVAEDAA